MNEKMRRKPWNKDITLKYGDSMKKLLLGLLALGSISAHAELVKSGVLGVARV
jgi:hypothetical protein